MAMAVTHEQAIINHSWGRISSARTEHCIAPTDATVSSPRKTRKEKIKEKKKKKRKRSATSRSPAAPLEEEKLSICAPPERAAVADPWNGQDGGGGGGPRNTSRPPPSIARGGRRAHGERAVRKEDWGRCRAGGSDSWWGAERGGGGG